MFERLLNQPPYSLKQADKEPLLLEGLNELTRYHYEKSPEYKRIIDESGAPLPADAVGTVIYEGPNVMSGYAMSRADLSNGDEMKGRLETGDLGRLDAEGFLYLTGRTKRFAKIAGYRLGLDEIEQELFAVCPVACLDLGEKIAVAHEQESEVALKARVRELADSYKVPSSSFALRKITQIPRASSGKIDYARLKDLVSV